MAATSARRSASSSGSRRLPGDRDPQRQMTDQRSRVDRQAGVVEGLDVAREVRPLPAHGPVGVDRGVGRAREVGDRRRERDATHPAVAVDLGGHALRDLADRPTVAQEREVRVAVEVDPARRDDTVRGIDPFGPAVAAERSPMATIRPPATPTSARRRGAPVPSMTEPPASTRSRPGTPITP